LARRTRRFEGNLDASGKQLVRTLFYGGRVVATKKAAPKKAAPKKAPAKKAPAKKAPAKKK
jgi:hypothetical protein